MAKINFPDPSTTNPWYNPANGITYNYVNNVWNAVTTNLDFEDTFVNVTGDTMTGPLTATSFSGDGSNLTGVVIDITTQTDPKYLRSDVSDSIAGSASLSFGNDVRQMLNLYNTVYGIGVQSNTLYCRSDGRFSWHRGGQHDNNENNPGSGGTTAMTLDANSNLTAAGNVTAYSDINLKKDIEVIPNALDKVSQIRGVTYQRKDLDVPRQSGVIAQEVEKVLPEVVMEDPTGTKSVAYGNLVGLLIEAIKELKAEVETLKQERN